MFEKLIEDNKFVINYFEYHKCSITNLLISTESELITYTINNTKDIYLQMLDNVVIIYYNNQRYMLEYSNEKMEWKYPLLSLILEETFSSKNIDYNTLNLIKVDTKINEKTNFKSDVYEFENYKILGHIFVNHFTDSYNLMIQFIPKLGLGYLSMFQFMSKYRKNYDKDIMLDCINENSIKMCEKLKLERVEIIEEDIIRFKC